MRTVLVTTFLFTMMAMLTALLAAITITTLTLVLKSLKETEIDPHQRW